MTTRERTPAARLTTAVGLGLVLTAAAAAQDPNPDRPRNQVTATYLGVAPRDDLALKFVGDKQRDPNNKPGEHVRPVGRLSWTVPMDQDAASGLVEVNERNFPTYCAEPMVGVVAGRTYNFEIQSVDSPKAYGLPDDEPGRKEAALRATYVRELYGRFYTRQPKDVVDPEAALAFQTALWEVIFEGELPANLEPAKAPFDLTTGTFRTNYANLDVAPAYVRTAQKYLKDLTGNDESFYSSPEVGGRELVRLRGLPGMFNGVADTPQSQLALRATSGGTGAAFGATLGGAAGVGGIGPVGGGAGGGFGGGGGVAGGLGGGGGGLLAGGSGGTTTPTTTTVPPTNGQTTTPPTSPPTTQITIPPTNQPPNTPPGTIPPTNQPPTTPPGTPGTPTQTSTNPVPAPAGLVLGVIALGAGGWIVRRRKAAAPAN